MPATMDWLYFIYVSIGFIVQIMIVYYLGLLVSVKQDWAINRCNPLYMGFADNVEENFNYCVQNTQLNFMGYILQPFNYILSVLSSMGGEFTQSIDYIRVMISSIRTFFTSIVQNIFGVFLNIIIEFQKIIISIKDLVGKLIGILTVFMYLIEGSILSLEGINNSSTMKVMRDLGNFCFHPDTMLKLKNGKTVAIKNIQIDDVLEDGSVVLATIQSVKRKDNPLFKFENNRDNNNNIYVTGSHYVMFADTNTFIEVKHHPKAKLCMETSCSHLCSLITNTHLIKIGDYIFWDYEDDYLQGEKMGYHFINNSDKIIV